MYEDLSRASQKLEEMRSFVNYIRTLKAETPGVEKRYRKDKPRDEQLSNDSISDITDLSQEGVLTQS
jgi:hypothetical protein